MLLPVNDTSLAQSHKAITFYNFLKLENIETKLIL